MTEVSGAHVGAECPLHEPTGSSFIPGNGWTRNDRPRSFRNDLRKWVELRGFEPLTRRSPRPLHRSEWTGSRRIGSASTIVSLVSPLLRQLLGVKRAVAADDMILAKTIARCGRVDLICIDELR
jgi:hypothetical protein